MKRWRWTDRGPIVAAIFFLGGAAAAHAQATLGASLGYSHFSYPDESDVSNNVVGILNAQDWGQPGLRAGYLFPDGKWALNADIGLSCRSGTVGPDLTSLEVLPQVQLSPWSRSGYSPFASVGEAPEQETADFGPEGVSTARATLGPP